MRIPNKIFISEDSKIYLEKRNLRDHFIKAKNNILSGNVTGGTRFHIREPKSKGVRYFRINRQYRALCEFDENNNLLVTSIDDHK